MKYYYSKQYKNAQGQLVDNVFFILNPLELETLSELLVPLRATMLTWPSTSVKLNNKDWQALEFLQRMQAPEHGGELIDPTDWQITGIVDKLLIKTTGMDFITWLNPCLEHDDLTAEDIRAHMAGKRRQLALGKSTQAQSCSLFEW